MERGSRTDFDLPENQGSRFDEHELEEAMRQYRREAFASLAQLDH